MIDQILPREYVHKFMKGWSVDKVNRIYGENVFTIEKRHTSRSKIGDNESPLIGAFLGLMKINEKSY